MDFAKSDQPYLKLVKRMIKKFDFDNAYNLLTILYKEDSGDKEFKEKLEVVKRYSENSNEKKVNFIIAGVQKGGTSALFNFLQKHPEICTSPYRKEVHYFDSSGISTKYSNYHKVFFPTKEHKIIGEATPRYMFYPGAMEQIKLYNPNMKIIVLLRDPLKRLYSQINMTSIRANKKGKSKKVTFEKIVNDFELNDQFSLSNYIRRGIYTPQLDKIYSLFPKEQVLVIKNEDLNKKHDQVLQSVFEFLGVEQLKVQQKQYHKHPYKEPIDKVEYEALKEYFLDDVNMLQNKYNIDTSDWLKGP